MKRAFLVTTSTVLGVAAVLSYQPGSQTTQALMELTGAAEPLSNTTPDATTPAETAPAPTADAPTTDAAATPSATATTAPKANASTKPSASQKPSATPKATTTTAPAPTKTADAAPAPTKAATTRTLTGTAFPALHGRESYGDVVATVTLDGNTMTALTLSQSRGGKNERYIDAVRQYLLPAILQAQDVNVGYVSGATATSEAFIQSLQAALAKK